MKKQTTFLDQIFGQVIKLIATVTLASVTLLVVTSLEFTITKKKNSFIENVSDVADSAYTTYSSLKKVMK